MKKTVGAFLFFLCFHFFIHANDKFLIVSHHCAQPFFIELQVKTFQKFLLDDYEFVVFNDAKTQDLENEINELCARYNIRCIRIDPKIHQRPYLPREPEEDYNHPSVRCVNAVQYSLDILGFDFPGLVIIMDSDMFPIQPISFSEFMKEYDLVGVAQSRSAGMKYIWTGFVMLNMPNLPNRRSINFNCGRVDGVSVDTGGHTHYYISEYENQIRMRFLGCEIFADTVQAYNDGHLTENRKHLIPLINLSPEGNMETLLDGKILHYRGGSLWDPKPAEYYKKKNEDLCQYIEGLLNQKNH